MTTSYNNRGVRLDARGEGSFEALVTVAFLPLWLICYSGSFPAAASAARSGSFELGTSRVVSKEGERSEANVSKPQDRLD